jgi:hypothetical protein
MSALSPEQNHAVGPQAPGVASGHTFLLAAVTSYLALRSRTPAGYRRMERVADVSFLVGLTFMAVVCCLIAYQVV